MAIYEFNESTDNGSESDFNYRIVYADRKTGELKEKIVYGYFVVNSLFGAVCRGEGIIHFSIPYEDIREVEALSGSQAAVN